ncbi:hypothetical protein MLD38_023040 [Melastoma candidum]|uniref:Uncharacterized protein n=1 Tax=Melastoma candidum TaxID=119954 RepID=A0ACB9QME8_9MYRT|nr:hypothetical protein MLD38_023040 [Melastoma candidum]
MGLITATINKAFNGLNFNGSDSTPPGPIITQSNDVVSPPKWTFATGGGGGVVCDSIGHLPSVVFCLHLHLQLRSLLNPENWASVSLHFLLCSSVWSQGTLQDDNIPLLVWTANNFKVLFLYIFITWLLSAGESFLCSPTLKKVKVREGSTAKALTRVQMGALLILTFAKGK